MTGWHLIGRASFWLGWPALFAYLYASQRTRVVIQADDSVLMVRGWLSSGHWLLPGGGLRRGEDPLDGVVREVQEETGVMLDVAAIQYLGRFRTTAGLRYTYHAFGVRLDEPPPVRPQKYEITDIAWLAMDEIKHNLRLEESTAKTLQAWFTR
jgi:8-oxo-dGTP pyrophosphatase MutT (NUDIX family)